MNMTIAALPAPLATATPIDQYAHVLLAHAQGTTYSAMARTLGCTVGRIAGLVHRARASGDLPPADPVKPRRSNPKAGAVLAAIESYKQGGTLEEVARSFGISGSTLQSHVRRLRLAGDMERHRPAPAPPRTRIRTKAAKALDDQHVGLDEVADVDEVQDGRRILDKDWGAKADAEAGITGVLIWQAETGTCRWPLWGHRARSGDENYGMVCGCQAMVGLPYCPRHTMRGTRTQ